MRRWNTWLAIGVLILSISACGMMESGPICEPTSEGGYYLTDHDLDGRPYPRAYYDNYDDCEEALMTGPAYPDYPPSQARFIPLEPGRRSFSRVSG